MAKMTIVKGPGRFDLFTGYIRANLDDHPCFEVTNGQSRLSVTIDLQELIPVDNLRNVWRFKGVMMSTERFNLMRDDLLKGAEAEWTVVSGRYYLNYDRGVQHGSLEAGNNVICCASKLE